LFSVVKKLLNEETFQKTRQFSPETDSCSCFAKLVVSQFYSFASGDLLSSEQNDEECYPAAGGAGSNRSLIVAL